MEQAIPILPADDLRVAKKFYVDVKRSPGNEEWGARTFSVTDPFGNTIFVMGPVR